MVPEIDKWKSACQCKEKVLCFWRNIEKVKISHYNRVELKKEKKTVEQ